MPAIQPSLGKEIEKLLESIASRKNRFGSRIFAGQALKKNNLCLRSQLFGHFYGEKVNWSLLGDCDHV